MSQVVTARADPIPTFSSRNSGSRSPICPTPSSHPQWCDLPLVSAWPAPVGGHQSYPKPGLIDTDGLTADAADGFKSYEAKELRKLIDQSRKQQEITFENTCQMFHGKLAEVRSEFQQQLLEMKVELQRKIDSQMKTTNQATALPQFQQLRVPNTTSPTVQNSTEIQHLQATFAVLQEQQINSSVLQEQQRSRFEAVEADLAKLTERVFGFLTGPLSSVTDVLKNAESDRLYLHQAVKDLQLQHQEQKSAVTSETSENDLLTRRMSEMQMGKISTLETKFDVLQALILKRGAPSDASSDIDTSISRLSSKTDPHSKVGKRLDTSVGRLPPKADTASRMAQQIRLKLPLHQASNSTRNSRGGSPASALSPSTAVQSPLSARDKIGIDGRGVKVWNDLYNKPS